jgi:hypothetical protein
VIDDRVTSFSHCKRKKMEAKKEKCGEKTLKENIVFQAKFVASY